MAILGHQDLTVRVPDVALEPGAAAGRVDADERGTRKNGGAAHEEILGDVLEQHADVEGTFPPPRQQRLRPLAARRDVLPPAPLLVLEEERRGIVFRPRQQEISHRQHRFAFSPSSVDANPAHRFEDRPETGF